MEWQIPNKHCQWARDIRGNAVCTANGNYAKPCDEERCPVTDRGVDGCPECGGRLSFGLSKAQWLCTTCGLTHKVYTMEMEG